MVFEIATLSIKLYNFMKVSIKLYNFKLNTEKLVQNHQSSHSVSNIALIILRNKTFYTDV